MAYTVDEVSDTLGVPRPTLYRYLREYSVPHLRRAGKIYVPEESFDRIQEIRELHREGLDTESVRRRLQAGSSAGAEGLVERLDRISETLEDLGGTSKPAANGASTAQALQTVLARQTLLISAVSNLTGMMEDLLAVNGLRRKVNPGNPETVAWEQDTFVDDLEMRPEIAEDTSLVTNGSVVETPPKLTPPPSSRRPSTFRVQRGKFGTLTRQRRRGAVVILLTLLTGAAVLLFLSYGGAFGVPPEEPPEPTQEEVPAGSEEVSAESSVAPSPDSVSQDEEAPTSDTEEDYDASSREQPPDPAPYPVQDVAPGPFYQEQPVQQNVVPGSPYGGQPIPQPGDVGFAPALQ